MTKQNFKIEFITNEYLTNKDFQTEKKYDYAYYFVKQSKFFDSLNIKNAPLYDLYDEFVGSKLCQVKNNIAAKRYDAETMALVAKYAMPVEVKISNGKGETIIQDQKLPDSLLKFLTVYDDLVMLNKQLDKEFNKNTFAASIEKMFSPTAKGDDFHRKHKNKINLIKIKMNITKNAITYLKASQLDSKKMDEISGWLAQADLPSDKNKLIQYTALFSPSSPTLQME